MGLPTIEPLQYVYLDIETNITSSQDLIQEITESVKPPGNLKKQETIDKWEREAKPEVIQQAIDKTALDGSYGEVIAIGLAVDDSTVTVATADTEAELLKQFANVKAEVEARPFVVGWNIQAFDIPFLWKRLVFHGIKAPSWFPWPHTRSDQVDDLMLAWCGYRDYMSLDRICKCLGIRHDDNLDGSEVPAAYREGRIGEVVDHCTADVAAVREVHRSMRRAGWMKRTYR